MEAIYKNWKNGSITAKVANEQLSAIDDKGLVFANPIIDGVFRDPITDEPIRTHDDKLSTLLFGNTILSSETIISLIKNVEFTDPNRYPQVAVEVLSELPSEPDKSEFIGIYRGKLRHPMTNKELTDEELKMVYDRILGLVEFENDIHNVGQFQNKSIDYLRPRPGGGGGGQGGGGKKKRKTKRRKSIKRSKRSNKLKKTKRRKTRRK